MYMCSKSPTDASLLLWQPETKIYLEIIMWPKGIKYSKCLSIPGFSGCHLGYEGDNIVIECIFCIVPFWLFGYLDSAEINRGGLCKLTIHLQSNTAAFTHRLNFEFPLKAASAFSSDYRFWHLTSIPEANWILKHNVSTFTLQNSVVGGLTAKYQTHAVKHRFHIRLMIFWDVNRRFRQSFATGTNNSCCNSNTHSTVRFKLCKN